MKKKSRNPVLNLRQGQPGVFFTCLVQGWRADSLTFFLDVLSVSALIVYLYVVLDVYHSEAHWHKWVCWHKRVIDIRAFVLPYPFSKGQIYQYIIRFMWGQTTKQVWSSWMKHRANVHFLFTHQLRVRSKALKKASENSFPMSETQDSQLLIRRSRDRIQPRWLCFGGREMLRSMLYCAMSGDVEKPQVAEIHGAQHNVVSHNHNVVLWCKPPKINQSEIQEPQY